MNGGFPLMPGLWRYEG